MKRTIWKKSIAIIITVTLIATMIGCGIKGDDSRKSENQVQADARNMIYEAIDFPLEGLEGDPSTISVQNGKLYIETYQYSEDTSQEEGEEKWDESEDTGLRDDDIDTVVVSRLYSVNVDGSNLKEIPMNIPEDEEFYNLMFMPDDTMIYTSSQYDDRTGTSSVDLVRLGVDGKEQQRETISDSLDLGEYGSVNGLKVDCKGNILVLGQEKLFVLDKNFKSQGEVNIDKETYLAGIALAKDGQIICGESVYKDNDSKDQVQELDLDSKKWGKAYPVEIAWFSGNGSILDGGGDYDFYFKDESGIYGYDIAQKKGIQLMDYMASGLSPVSTESIVPTGDGRFIGIVYDESERASIVMYDKVDSATMANCKTITYGTRWVSEDVENAIVKFNKTNTEYQIEIKDYSNEEDPQAKMTADIIAGNVPDIIDVSGLSVEQYISKGLLEDMTPYFEGDSEICMEDIIPSVYEAMQIEGKLYYIAPNINLNTMVGKKKYVGTENGWTYDDLKGLHDKVDKDTQLFYTGEKKMILENLLNIGLTDFIDWISGECLFDSQNFKEILEVANENGVDEEDEWGEDMPEEQEMFRDDKVLLRTIDLDMDDYLIAEEVAGDELNYIGYPNKDKLGSYFTFNTQIAMYSKSDVKDGAWEFVRTFMTKEYQGKTMDRYYIPTRQDCFNLMIEAAMTTEKYTNEMGREIFPREGGYDYGNMVVEEKPMTQKQADEFIAIIDNTKKCGRYDWTLMEIVEEEAEHYFAGEKSLDVTVDIIQNRIKTYVNENR